MIELNDFTGQNNMKIVTIGTISFYFSYNTCIAFIQSGTLYISKNVWSRTTGKHLNAIDDDKSIRMEHEAFASKLNSLYVEEFGKVVN